MINIQLQNCNNINSANINIEENFLNICFAVNGTGKSTIAKAVELKSNNENLSLLQPFDPSLIPSSVISNDIKNVFVFNEDFVNNIVFTESEVIENAFDVFIRTPEYDERQRIINQRLKDIHIDLGTDNDLNTFISMGDNILRKFTFLDKKRLKKIGLLKSLTDTGSIFELPQEIQNFQPLMDKDYTIDWIGWKNDGSKYDDNNICPFCTNPLSDVYENEKQIFSSSYQKSNVKNIKEMITYLNVLNDYIDEEEKEKLFNCIKKTNDDDTIIFNITKFIIELDYLIKKIKKVIEFNSFDVKREDISRLDVQLNDLIIDTTILQIFISNKTINILNSINSKIRHILVETNELKQDIGILKGLINDKSKYAVNDINQFLKLSGINYEFEISNDIENENDTHARLKYSVNENDSVIVNNIKDHLSWGERNAFALILFMHYSLSQNPDLIILDDPISSFDENKKYAIINRLFLNGQNQKSFYNKTVLMLTHDIQPIIDFIKNNKPTGSYVKSFFMKNLDGNIFTQDITKDDIKSLPVIFAKNAKNEELNPVHRIICLRKLFEHSVENESLNLGYNLLSCLIHGKNNPTFVDGTEITGQDMILGEAEIKKYIPNFSYEIYSNNIFSINNLIALFHTETNSYFKIQVFRIIIAIKDLRSSFQNNTFLKYIDEQFHIENDYIFCLDYCKFDLVPDYILSECKNFLNSNEEILKN